MAMGRSDHACGAACSALEGTAADRGERHVVCSGCRAAWRGQVGEQWDLLCSQQAPLAACGAGLGWGEVGGRARSRLWALRPEGWWQWAPGVEEVRREDGASCEGADGLPGGQEPLARRLCGKPLPGPVGRAEGGPTGASVPEMTLACRGHIVTVGRSGGWPRVAGGQGAAAQPARDGAGQAPPRGLPRTQPSGTPVVPGLRA